MDPIHGCVSAFLGNHGIPRDRPVLVAASAGADSTALTHVLASLGQRIGVAHVHHGLRGIEADRDVEFVEATARALGVPSFVERVEAARPDGRSPEARARALRYEALQRVRARRGYELVATGHTMDDQAETVLLRAVRGAGPAGLAGVAPLHAEQCIVRPFLGVRRTAVRGYLSARGLTWREDATNADLQVPRNRIRHTALGPLEAAHPGAVRALARLAEDARELALWLGTEAERALAHARRAADGGLVLDRDRIVSLPEPVRLYAIADLLARAGLGDRLSREHLRRVEGVVVGEEKRARVSLPGGRILAREGARLWLGSVQTLISPPGLSVSLAPPGALDLRERGVRFEWRRLERPETHASEPNALQLPDDLQGGLRVRTAAPGDRIRVVGESRERPLTELFRLAKWSSWERRSALVITWHGRVVWVVGLAGAELPVMGEAPGWELRAVWLSGRGGSC